MLVFSDARLAFLAVPKTGSTAYHTALADRADVVITGPPQIKHAPVYRYNRWIRPMFERTCDIELETMALMREPISWLGSWYRYRRRPSLQGQANATHDVSFDDFVLAYLKGKRPAFADVGSQAKFLEPQPNGVSVTYLFRYEDRERIREFLESRLDVTLSLGRENTSPKMALTLSPGVEKRLRRKCAAEFELYDSIAQ